jgi:hypothetical protein
MWKLRFMHVNTNASVLMRIIRRNYITISLWREGSNLIWGLIKPARLHMHLLSNINTRFLVHWLFCVIIVLMGQKGFWCIWHRTDILLNFFVWNYRTCAASFFHMWWLFYEICLYCHYEIGKRNKQICLPQQINQISKLPIQLLQGQSSIIRTYKFKHHEVQSVKYFPIC